MTQISPLPEADTLCPACGHPRSGEPSNQTGLAFCQACRLPHAIIAGKYKIEKKLAEGGCGVLYLAQHTKLKMEPMRVIKFLKPEYFTHAHAGQRFAREVEVTAALSQRNQHIVRVYDDFGQIPDLGHFYIMEYLRGQDLQEYTTSLSKPLPLDTMLHIIRQLLEAMAEAHEAQIIHRDLKPHNIFLLQRGEDKHFVKVIDFGIAKGLSAFADTGMTQGVIGTPEYMAPEQCTGQDTDQRTDIYAIGMIMYQLLVGHTPFLPPGARGVSAMNMAIAQMMEEPTPPSQASPHRDIPPALEAVIMRAIQKSPDHRFSSIQELQDALIDANPYKGTTPEIPGVILEEFQRVGLPSADSLPGVPLPAPEERQAPVQMSSPTDAPVTSQTPESQHRLWLVAVGIVMIFCGGLGGIWLWRDTRPTQPPSKKILAKKQPHTVPLKRSNATKRATPRPVRPQPTPRPTRKRRSRRIAKRRKVTPKRRPRKGPCPLAPKGQHWVALKITPTHIKPSSSSPITKGKRGRWCLLATPGKKVTVTFLQAGFHQCIVALPARTRRAIKGTHLVSIRLRREADRIDAKNLEPSMDYCLR